MTIIEEEMELREKVTNEIISKLNNFITNTKSVPEEKLYRNKYAPESMKPENRFIIEPINYPAYKTGLAKKIRGLADNGRFRYPGPGVLRTWDNKTFESLFKECEKNNIKLYVSISAYTCRINETWNWHPKEWEENLITDLDQLIGILNQHRDLQINQAYVYLNTVEDKGGISNLLDLDSKIVVVHMTMTASQWDKKHPVDTKHTYVCCDEIGAHMNNIYY